MKKYASLLLFAIMLNGCDDGNLTVDTIDFEDVAAASCTNTVYPNTLIYKIQKQESILLQLPQGSIIDEPTMTETLPDKPTVYYIDNTSYRVVYRAYDGAVASDNICGAIPPRTPNVTEEWQANGGEISITTTQSLTAPDETTGATRITGYNHNIIFNNITFMKPAGDQTEKQLVFGIYKTTPAAALNLVFPETASQCTTAKLKQVYNFNGSASLIIDNIDPALLVNVPTLGKPRTSVITETTNKVTYRSFTKGTGTLTSDYFCKDIPPLTPTVEQTWNTDLTKNSTIEVSTTSAGTAPNVVYTHTIVLKAVTLTKGNSHFYLANNFTLGTITVKAAQ